VLVVPDGALHYVPCATLIEPVHHVPLTLRHELVTLPSATMLTLLRGRLQGRPPAAKLLAVLADPVFDVTDPRVRASAPGRSTAVERIEPMRRLSRLPFSREEADRILAAAPFETSLKALDFDASRTTATGTDLSQYRILHFATHAVQDDEHPGLSGIVLSLVRRDGNPQDGFLRLHDLFGLRLQADLVVLSACETGTGRQTGGEGLASLSRGFFYAGAARVVSSLWKVDDEATARLMELFYKALFARAQMSPAAALQAAQTAMMKQKRWEDPHYWSAFVLQGDW
jgi:CHAT domain-containing protein